MGKITALRTGRGKEKKTSIFVDGKLAFSLGTEVATTEGLQIGQELSDNHVAKLVKSDQSCRCLEVAWRLLGYRPRSESELRARLARRGFDANAIDAAIARLKEQDLVDDAAFARFWKENRDTFSPRSQRLTRLELRRKGVPGDVIDQVVNLPEADDDNAYRAALGKAGRLPLSDYESFRRRLGDYLRRRGFDYDVINGTVERLWRERGSDK